MPTAANPAASEPITVSANAGAIDALQAAARLIVVVVTAVPILLQLIGKHDLVALIGYLQGQDGVAFIGAISGLLTIAYAIFKTHKRGAQIATVAADARVPDKVATLTT